MRVMQTAGIKERRTKGGNDGVKGEETDEIIEQDGGIYWVVLPHKSVSLLFAFSPSPPEKTSVIVLFLTDTYLTISRSD